MARWILSAVGKLAVIAAGMAILAALAGAALDNELDAHAREAFGAAYDPAE